MHRFAAPTALALALMLTLAAPATAENRALSGFSAVAASGDQDVEVVQGADFAVTVEGEDARRVRTVVRDGQLRVSQRLRVGVNWGRPDVRVRVQLPRIEALSASQGAKLRISGVTASELRLSASLGGLLEADHVEAGVLSLQAAQGGSIEASGSCEALDATASLGGVIEAQALSCASAEAHASTGALMELHATNSIDANASLGGEIEVSGNPGVRTSGARMGGEVEIR